MNLKNLKIATLIVSSVTALSYYSQVNAADKDSYFRSPLATYSYDIKTLSVNDPVNSNTKKTLNNKIANIKNKRTAISNLLEQASQPTIASGVHSLGNYKNIEIEANTNSSIFNSTFKAFRVESAILWKGLAKLSIEEIAQEFQQYLHADGYIYAKVTVKFKSDSEVVLSIYNPTFGEIIFNRENSNIREGVDSRLWKFSSEDAFTITPIKNGLEELVSYRNYKKSTVDAEKQGGKVNLVVNYYGRGPLFNVDLIPYDSGNANATVTAVGRFRLTFRDLILPYDTFQVSYHGAVQQPEQFSNYWRFDLNYGINAPKYNLRFTMLRSSIVALPQLNPLTGRLSARGVTNSLQYVLQGGPKFDLGNDQELATSLRLSYYQRERFVPTGKTTYGVNTLLTTSINYVKRIGLTDSYGFQFDYTVGSNIFNRLGVARLINEGRNLEFPDPTIKRLRLFTNNDLIVKNSLFSNNFALTLYSADKRPLYQSFTGSTNLIPSFASSSNISLRSTRGYEVANTLSYYINGDKRTDISYRVIYDVFNNLINPVDGIRDTKMMWHELSFNVNNYNGILFNLSIGKALIKPIIKLDNTRTAITFGYRY